MMNIEKIPVEYRPVSPFGYFGYSLLFSIPVIGWIFIIIFALSNSNINRRNFARSYFCGYFILLIVAVIFGLSGGFAFVLGLLR